MKTINQTGQFVLSFLLLCIFITSANAQALFQTRVGEFARIEEVWDGKPIANGTGGYAILASSQTGLPAVPPTQIVVTKLDANGVLTSSFSIQDSANPNDAYAARALEVDQDALGNPIGFFITGQRIGGGGRQAVVIRTDLNGTVTWATILQNVVGGNVLSETGVGIERQPNGDIIVVGVSFDPVANVNKPLASRLNAATGATVWAAGALRYGSAAGQSFLATESCNGTIGGLAVVAITGKHTENNVDRTFAMTINAATGAEVWANRIVYQSNRTRDEGSAIVQNPVTGRFMVVGQAFDNLGQSDLWVVNLNNNGTIWNSAVYDLGVDIQVFFGRGVCLSVNGNNAAITGHVWHGAPAQAATIRQFAMELGWGAAGNAAAPTWMVEYSGPFPSPFGSESIERITGPSSGYFLTSSFPVSSIPSRDQDALRVNNLGMHPFFDCPIYPFLPAVVNQGKFVNKAKNVALGSWLPLTVDKQDRTMTQDFCIGIPVQNEEVGSRSGNDEAVVLPSGTALVFPNPASGDATLRFDLDEEQPVQITVADLSGRVVWSEGKTLGEGRHEINLPSAKWLPGAYFVRIVTDKKQQTLKLNVIH